MHKLTIEDDEGKTVVVPLIRDEITVGRQEGNSIRLTERNISRRHARFYRETGNLLVEDLGSFNGIKVNGARITTATGLKDGDLVIIGDYKLTVRADKPVSTRLYAGGAPFSSIPGGTAPLPAPGAPAPAGGISAAPLGATAPLVRPQAPAPAVTPLRGGGAGATAGAAPAPAAPAPDATLEAAPTIPVRTLAEQGMSGPDAVPPARLVVVSTNLAGSEFVLDRPSLVIGRTPENDIVLNHKSISRHHAKIIRDGDKYIVVDLESANGVRVNGSEFERVELQSGDTVELGHVRLKFSAGNDYVDFDMSAGAGNRRKVIIGGAVGAMALAGVVLALAVGGDDGATSGTPAGATTSQAPEGTPSPAPIAPTPIPSPGPAVEALLGEARTAMQQESWTAAADAVQRALAAAPTSAEAAALKETIDSELQASERFARLKQAADGKRFEEVLTLFPTIPESSVYRPRAVPLKDGAQGKLVAQNLTEAERLEVKGQCDEARAAVERVTALEPDNVRARTVVEKCDQRAAKVADKQKREEEALAAREARAAEKQKREEEAAAAREARAAERQQRREGEAAAAPREAPAPRPAAAVPAPARPALAERPVPPVRAPVEGRPAPAAPRPAAAARPTPPAPAAEAPPAGDPDALIQEATQSWLRGQYAAAIETSRRALRIRPNMVRAYQIIAVCSCNLRDTDGASKAYERLEDRLKPLVKSACQKNGITLQ
jgi:ABC transport system ATP-binding/permease protein